MKRILAGQHAVLEALDGARSGVVAVYVEPGEQPGLSRVVLAARSHGVLVEARPRAELDALSRGVRHQGVVAIAGEYPYVDLEELLARAKSPPIVVALDEITDPHNFGAIVRSVVALGADGVITLRDRAAPVTPVVVRASAGATERTCIARVTNLGRALTALSERGLEIVGLAPEGEAIISALPPAPGGRVLVVGSEGRGLRRLVRERCSVIARIEQKGPIGSLNVSVAAGIAVYEMMRRTYG